MSWRSWLEQQVQAGTLRPLDYMLAEAVAGLATPDGPSDGRVLLAAALASRAVGEGSPCLELATLPAVLDELGAGVPAPTLDELTQALAASGICSDQPDTLPLVLWRGRLYLQRYAAFEAELARRLLQRARVAPEPPTVPVLDRRSPQYLWAPEVGEGVNAQAVACAVALSSRLAVITGGPGTGKTYTVVRLLLALLAQARAQGLDDYRIGLAAPTGKAAQRIAEALLLALEGAGGNPGIAGLLADDWIAERLPRNAATLHRLLGARPGTNRYRHDADHPLELDALVVDECSMVDLSLMTRLLRALKPDARLVLLGDRHQLVSVEAGNVLPELCDAGSGQLPGQRQMLQEATGERLPESPPGGPLAGHVVELTRGFRSRGAVAALATAINAGDGQGAVALLGSEPALSLRPVARTAVAETVSIACEQGWFAELRRAESPAAALAALARFRVLAALNHGPWGIDRLNQHVETALALQYGFDPSGGYHLRPLLVLRNDYRLGLFNGDVGVVFREEGQARAWFSVAERDERGRVTARRRLVGLPVTSLPQHCTCYAMTVHKSQGSEFDAVTLVLPETDSPVLSRELVYTAVTRARERVSLWAPAELLATVVRNRSSRRMSGLGDRLREQPLASQC